LYVVLGFAASVAGERSSTSQFNDRKHVYMKQTFRPGQLANRSGQYEIIGPRGGRTGKERTVTQGEPLPPTPEADQRYILVDITKH
jgi:hypothetical protein